MSKRGKHKPSEPRKPSVYRIGDIPVVIRGNVDELSAAETKALEVAERAILDAVAAGRAQVANRLALAYERRVGITMAERFASMGAATTFEAQIEGLIGVAATAITSPEAKKRNRNRGRGKASPPREIGKAKVVFAGDSGAIHEAAELEANREIVITDDTSVVKRRHQRFDVFSLLYFPPRGRMLRTSYLAVRRLQEDMAALHRTQGACDAIRSSGKGQTGAIAAFTEDFALARIRAGDRIESVLNGWYTPTRMFIEGTEPWAAKLLRELCESEVVRGQTPNWHAIVSRHTGEMDRAERGRLVRRACDDLAESYRRIDNEPREKVA